MIKLAHPNIPVITDSLKSYRLCADGNQLNAPIINTILKITNTIPITKQPMIEPDCLQHFITILLC